MSLLAVYIMKMLTQVLDDIRFSRQLRHKNINQWPPGLQAKFQNAKIEVVLAVGAG